MSAGHHHRLLLWAAATDRTFSHDGEVLVGKCIHCRRKLALSSRGVPVSDATLEHILPRHHGGTDALDNLAVACKTCNNLKGTRHDHKRPDDPGLRHLVEVLQARRRERWRPPLPSLSLPPLPAPDDGPDETSSSLDAGRRRGRRRRRR